jgi:hypothetical protein
VAHRGVLIRRMPGGRQKPPRDPSALAQKQARPPDGMNRRASAPKNL